MPKGRYTVFADRAERVGTEAFRCAPGPAGWRYVSEIDTDVPTPHRESVDVTVDRSWRIVRARIDTGAHDILLESRGDVLVGSRDSEPIEIPYGLALHLDYFTPATNAITCRRLAGTTEIDVVYLAAQTLDVSRVRQRYERGPDEYVQTPVGRFASTRWTFTDLDSGWTADLWVSHDVVVAYERLFDLAEYEPGASGVAPLSS